jgi:hypothetical protein
MILPRTPLRCLTLVRRYSVSEAGALQAMLCKRLEMTQKSKTVPFLTALTTLTTIGLKSQLCSVENLCEHACPTLNHRAENSRVYAALFL